MPPKCQCGSFTETNYQTGRTFQNEQGRLVCAHCFYRNHPEVRAVVDRLRLTVTLKIGAIDAN